MVCGMSQPALTAVTSFQLVLLGVTGHCVADVLCR
ncbi:Ms4533A family Cys-rich leader peptide [Streptomyces sp. NPDC058739]